MEICCNFEFYMNKRILVIFVFMVLCTLASARGKAFLVGIGDYPSESGWCKINSANDITLLKSVLTDYDITTLQDKAATYNGIVSSMKRFASSVQPGDTVIVHFSCHGQQMIQCVEDNAAEPDHLDEALVPYDALSKYSDSYKGERHLRDNEFSSLIDIIRQNASSNGLVLVLLDACHSDDSFRSTDDEKNDVVIRGARDIFGLSDESKYDSVMYRVTQLPIVTRDDLSPVIYISACKAYQVNREIVKDSKGYGPLTYSFAMTYTKGALSDLSRMVAIIKKTMGSLAPIQNIGVRSSIELSEPAITQTETQKPKPQKSAVQRLLDNLF